MTPVPGRRSRTQRLLASLRRSPATGAAVLASTGGAVAVVAVAALVHGLEVRPFADAGWPAAWARWARPAGAQLSELLADLTVTTRRVANATLIIAGASLLLHALSRSLADWRPLAVRAALGARLVHLFTALGTELLALTAAGTVLGLVVAGIMATALAAAPPALLLLPSRPASLGTSLAAGALAGLLVTAVALLLAWRRWAGRRTAAELRGARATTPRGALTLQSMLAVFQVAALLAVAYSLALIGPGRGATVERQAWAERIDSAPLRWTGTAATDPAARATAYAALARLLERDGLSGAAATSPGASIGAGRTMRVLGVCGVCFVAGQLRAMSAARVMIATTTADLAARPGRGFSSQDTIGAPLVAILDQTAARALFPGGDPVGRTLRADFSGRLDYTVIGVVPDAPGTWPGERTGTLYVSMLQHPPAQAELVWPAGHGDSVAALARAAAANAGLGALVGPTRPLIDRLAELWEPVSWLALPARALGLVAVILTAVAFVAVLFHQVAQRRRELGIRLALGARTDQVQLWMVGKSLTLTLAGLSIGVSAARWVGLALAGAEATADESAIVALLGLCAVFFLVALVAAWAPARRAAQVEPAEAMARD